jgi:ADP-L-glycero-D-manno-heptose 6-epimerase
METDDYFLIKNNFEFSKNLGQHTLGRGIHFVYASSATTSGDGERGIDDDEIR